MWELQSFRALGLVGFALQSRFQGFGSGFDVSKLYSQDPKVTVSLSPKTYNASPRKYRREPGLAGEGPGQAKF